MMQLKLGQGYIIYVDVISYWSPKLSVDDTNICHWKRRQASVMQPCERSSEMVLLDMDFLDGFWSAGGYAANELKERL